MFPCNRESVTKLLIIKMEVKQLILFCTIFLLYCCSSFAQQKANLECTKYQKLRNSLFQKPNGALNVIGGSLVREKEFPHMAALGYGSKNNRQWMCGGTIISKNYILTAAHCTSSREFGNVKIVRVNARNLKRDEGTDISIRNIIKHPEYKPPSQYNDIALLKLKNDIQFSSSVLPACLNTLSDVRSRTNKLTAAGWGLLSFAGSPSDNLMKVDLNIFTYGSCKSAYKNVPKRKLANGIDDATQICAGGGPNEEKDTCQGDSGGPLAMKSGSIYTVVGITSMGKTCGIPNSPAVYTRVSAYVPWIEKQVWS